MMPFLVKRVKSIQTIDWNTTEIQNYRSLTFRKMEQFLPSNQEAK